MNIVRIIAGNAPGDMGHEHPELRVQVQRTHNGISRWETVAWYKYHEEALARKAATAIETFPDNLTNHSWYRLPPSECLVYQTGQDDSN